MVIEYLLILIFYFFDINKFRLQESQQQSMHDKRKSSNLTKDYD